MSWSARGANGAAASYVGAQHEPCAAALLRGEASGHGGTDSRWSAAAAVAATRQWLLRR